MRYAECMEAIDIKNDMPDMADVMDALNEFCISITDGFGKYRDLSLVLSDVMQKWKHTISPKSSRQLGDIAQSLIYAIRDNRQIHCTDETSLDAFLCEFRITE